MLTILLFSLLSQIPTPTSPQSVKPNTPFMVEWTVPNGEYSQPEFRWVCDGSILKNFRTGEAIPQGPPSETGAITYRAQVPGLPMGPHTCHINALNFLGEVAGEDGPVPVGVLPAKPSAVTIIQITIVSGGGA